jgi:hypothetical protein
MMAQIEHKCSSETCKVTSSFSSLNPRASQRSNDLKEVISDNVKKRSKNFIFKDRSLQLFDNGLLHYFRGKNLIEKRNIFRPFDILDFELEGGNKIRITQMGNQEPYIFKFSSNERAA